MVPQLSPDSSVLANLSILLIEDNLDQCELLSLLFDKAGARVHCVHSAASALAALDMVEVDVLISDISISDSDGYELLRQVRGRDAEHGSYVPAIAASGWTRPVDRAEADAVGFDTFVAKPYSPSELMEVVEGLGPLIAVQRKVRAACRAQRIEPRALRERLEHRHETLLEEREGLLTALADLRHRAPDDTRSGEARTAAQ
jgi:two-component system, OmpR family, response regulator